MVETLSDIGLRGFVFLSDLPQSMPYWVRRWGTGVWMFYWHPDKKWVTLRQVDILDDVASMYSRRLPPKKAALYDGATTDKWMLPDDAPLFTTEGE